MMNERSRSGINKASGYRAENWSIRFWFWIISTQWDDEMVFASDISGFTRLRRKYFNRIRQILTEEFTIQRSRASNHGTCRSLELRSEAIQTELFSKHHQGHLSMVEAPNQWCWWFQDTPWHNWSKMSNLRGAPACLPNPKHQTDQ